MSLLILFIKEIRGKKSVFVVLSLAVWEVAGAEEWYLPSFRLFEPDIEPTPSLAAPDMPILSSMGVSDFVALVDDRLVTLFGNRVYLGYNSLQVIRIISSPVPKVFATQVFDNSVVDNSLFVIVTSLSPWHFPLECLSSHSCFGNRWYRLGHDLWIETLRGDFSSNLAVWRVFKLVNCLCLLLSFAIVRDIWVSLQHQRLLCLSCRLRLFWLCHSLIHC